MLRRVLYITVSLAFFAPATALADGGPSPGVIEAGPGVADNTIRYVTLSAGKATTLESIQTDGGQVNGSRNYRGSWGIPLVTFSGQTGGLSPNLTTLVLGQTGSGSCSAGTCSALRRTTRFQIVNPDTLRPRKTVTLKGDFAFDALSPDGHVLYLIQHKDLSHYLVRAYDLGRNLLRPGAIADRTQRGWIMEGSPMSRAVSKGGRFVYTLYQNPGGYPFVHELDTVRGVAHCIGLPLAQNQGLLQKLELTPGSGGRTLAVYTQQGRPYFTVDTRTYEVSRPRPVQVAPQHHGFPWWWLSLGAVPLLAAALLARRSWLVPVMPALRRRAPA